MDEHRVEGTQRLDDPLSEGRSQVSNCYCKRKVRQTTHVSRMTLKLWGGVPSVISEKYCALRSVWVGRASARVGLTGP